MPPCSGRLSDLIDTYGEEAVADLAKSLPDGSGRSNSRRIASSSRPRPRRGQSRCSADAVRLDCRRGSPGAAWRRREGSHVGIRDQVVGRRRPSCAGPGRCCAGQRVGVDRRRPRRAERGSTSGDARRSRRRTAGSPSANRRPDSRRKPLVAPKVEYDPAKLPTPVRRLREQIIEAAATGDPEKTAADHRRQRRARRSSATTISATIRSTI